MKTMSVEQIDKMICVVNYAKNIYLSIIRSFKESFLLFISDMSIKH